MSPILMALSVATGVMVLGWLLVSGTRMLARTRRRRSAASQSSVLDAGDARDGEWIYGDRTAPERQARTIARESGETTQGISFQGYEPPQTVSAAAEAEAIVRDAKLKAAEILAYAERERESLLDETIEVERERVRLEQGMQDVAREQALMAVKHKRLSEFLLTALEEIERASANGSAKIAGLQELRDELRSTE